MASRDPRKDSPRSAPSPRGLWLGRAAAALAGGMAVLGGMSLLGRKPRQPEAIGPSGGPVPGEDDSGRGSPGIPASRSARQAGHETTEASARAVGLVLAVFGLTAVGVIVGSVVGLNWIQRADRAARPPITTEQRADIVPPLPHLQVKPYDDLHEVRAHAAALLDQYGWADAAHTHARIPIDRAMALVVGKPLDPAP